MTRKDDVAVHCAQVRPTRDVCTSPPSPDQWLTFTRALQQLLQAAGQPLGHSGEVVRMRKGDRGQLQQPGATPPQLGLLFNALVVAQADQGRISAAGCSQRQANPVIHGASVARRGGETEIDTPKWH